MKRSAINGDFVRPGVSLLPPDAHGHLGGVRDGEQRTVALRIDIVLNTDSKHKAFNSRTGQQVIRKSNFVFQRR